MKQYSYLKRWTGSRTFDAGIIQSVGPVVELYSMAMDKALELAPLAQDRENFGAHLEMLYGENAAILNRGLPTC